MKNIKLNINMLVILLLLSGCSSVKDTNISTPLPSPSATEPSPTGVTNDKVELTPLPTNEVEVTVTPSTSKNDDANSQEPTFVKTDIKGLFTVDILNPLPSQMELSISASDDLTEGSISFDILSANPDCSPYYECMWTPYGFSWYTSEALEAIRKQINVSDDHYITEYDTSIGTVYIYRCYTANLNYLIYDGSYPDYVHDDHTMDYAIEDLIRW